jgi:Pectate lyase superfamily protein
MGSLTIIATGRQAYLQPPAGGPSNRVYSGPNMQAQVSLPEFISGQATYWLQDGTYTITVTDTTGAALSTGSVTISANKPVLLNLTVQIVGPRFDVRAAGAALDDTTDDSAAIQATINAAAASGGGRVDIPGKAFCGTTTIKMPSDVLICGNGREASYLRRAPGATNVLLDHSGTTTGIAGHVVYGGLQDITLYGTSPGTGPLLRTYYVDNFQCHNVKFTGAEGGFIDAVELWDSYFAQCSFQAGGGVNTGTPMVWMRNSSAASGFGYGSDNCNMVWFMQCRFEDWADGALWVQQGVNNVSLPNGIFLKQCKFETHRVNGPPIIFDGSTAHIHIDDADVVIGSFLAGYSTPVSAILLASQAHSSIRNVRFVGDDAVSSMANGVEIYASLGPTDVDNISHWGMIPTNAVVRYSGGNAGNVLRIGNIGSNNGAQLFDNSGVAPPLQLIQQLALAPYTTPPTPPATGLAVWARADGNGAPSLVQMRSDGHVQALQGALSTTRTVAFLPATGSGITTVGTTASTAGTLANPALSAATVLTRQRRTTLSTGTVAGTVAAVWSANTEAWGGNTAGVGGYLFTARFGLDTLQAGMRAFVGLSDVTTAPTNVDPTTATTPGKVGVAIAASTGHWQLVTNITGTAPSVTDLGASFPVDTSSLYDLLIYRAPNGGAGIGVTVTNVATATASSTVLSSNIQAAATFVTPVAWVTNNATSAAAVLALARLVVESTDT